MKFSSPMSKNLFTIFYFPSTKRWESQHLSKIHNNEASLIFCPLYEKICVKQHYMLLWLFHSPFILIIIVRSIFIIIGIFYQLEWFSSIFLFLVSCKQSSGARVSEARRKYYVNIYLSGRPLDKLPLYYVSNVLNLSD